MANIHPITTKSAQNVPGVLLGKPARTRRQRPRIRTPEQQAETMQVLYRWRDERRAYAAMVEAVKRERRWSGVRSIGLLVAISAVMVFALVAGSGVI